MPSLEAGSRIGQRGARDLGHVLGKHVLDRLDIPLEDEAVVLHSAPHDERCALAVGIEHDLRRRLASRTCG